MIFFCTVCCEVDSRNFFILNEFALFITTNHKLCIIQTTTSSIYFFRDEWNVLLFCVLFLSSLSYCAWSLSSDTSVSFVYPCSSTRLQTVTGELPSLLFIQLIEKCSLQWCRVVREYVEICDLLEDVWEHAVFCEQCAYVLRMGLGYWILAHGLDLHQLILRYLAVCRTHWVMHSH